MPNQNEVEQKRPCMPIINMTKGVTCQPLDHDIDSLQTTHLQFETRKQSFTYAR